MTGSAGGTIVLSAGRATATVHPADGGRLGQIEVDGRRLLRGPDEGAHVGWGYWGSYPLLPWTNRIPGGRFVHDGREFEVPVNWADGTAIHGLTAEEPWDVVALTTTTVEEVIELDTPAYRVQCRQSMALAESHLDLSLEVTNRAAQEVPVGIGIHPWFRAGAVRVPAELAWPGTGPMPEGPPRPVTPEEDLRSRRVPPPMDRCFTGLTDTAVDVPGVRLSWSGPVTQVVVYSEDPDWVCVEPVTMANDGFRLAADGVEGHGVIALAPEQSAAVRYRFDWSDSRDPEKPG